MSESFRIQEGVLYHRGKLGDARVIIDIKERELLVKALHDDPAGGGGHFGMNATIRKLAERFYWRGIAEDARIYIRGCPVCQKANPTNRPPAATLHPVPVGELFHRWGIDLVGPLNETARGNKYLCVATEYLSRWPEAMAMPDKSGESVHRFLTSLVYRFGAPNFILHDQGREFNNALDVIFHVILCVCCFFLNLMIVELMLYVKIH